MNSRFKLLEGAPFPLGATWDGIGTNFAIFSAHATRVELCLFDAEGLQEIDRIDLPEYTNEIWHGYLEGLPHGTIYGYRVHGPYDPANGHRFNRHKLLLDPYAKEHVGKLTWAPEIFGYTLGSSDADLSFDDRDSAPFVPKCRVVQPSYGWTNPHRPVVPWDRTVIYETHVRGYTRLHPGVPEELRGTFAGLSEQTVIEHLRRLGVNTIELMPIHTSVDEGHLLDRGMVNYWGYNTLGFFAADPRFFASGYIAEFKRLVDHYHREGLSIILDVVYNHTAEGNELGPTLSFKGIDNSSYYRLMPDNRRYYINDTGTGNTLNLSQPHVLQMVTDSLRYWASDLRVDGFRFDLATILGREGNGFDEGAGFFDSCRQDPVLAHVKLIGEPWDCGPGGYQVGGFPPGWAEWNDKFRDTVRSFWRGDAGMAGDFAKRITASGDCFNRRGRKPWASVNFVTAHDGFTLHDLVSYDGRHNEANGEDNRDGHNDNRSWNCGMEGPTDRQAVIALRERQKRNLLATLLLSQGTPMLLAGDEFGRTQRGNNNAYCQDNSISWVDWEGLDEHGRALQAFAARLIHLRRRLPVLRRNRFLTGDWNEWLDVTDAKWLSSTGTQLTGEQWLDPELRCFGLVIDGRAQASGIRRPASDATILLVFNASAEAVPFVLPKIPGVDQWTCLIDTAEPLRSELPIFTSGATYPLDGRSVLLLALEAKGEAEGVFADIRAALTAPPPASAIAPEPAPTAPD